MAGRESLFAALRDFVAGRFAFLHQDVLMPRWCLWLIAGGSLFSVAWVLVRTTL